MRKWPKNLLTEPKVTFITDAQGKTVPMTTTLGGRSTRTRGEAHADATETTKEAVTSIEEKASVNTKKSNAARTAGKYDRQ